MADDHVTLPTNGIPVDDVLAEIAADRSGDIDWRSGKAFSLVYNAADDELERLQHSVADDFLHENALNPFVYKTMLRMEQEIVAMAADLLGGPQLSGALTSGGTESIFCAIQTARDTANERGITAPVAILPNTAHPAFTKAGHYVGLEIRRIPVGEDGRADVAAMATAVDENTILLVGSTPCYPYGVIDPMAEIAALAAEHDLLCHVDACLGGWLLPFWEEIGETVPSWDLSTPGVTSLSADIHKYAYAYKGASVVLYNDRELLAKQHFIFDGWPGGIYASATTTGTRPGPPIAGAWATLRHLGRDGLVAKARVVRDTTRTMIDGLRSIGDLQTVHDPDMSVVCFTSPTVDIDAVADVMDSRGWRLDRQQEGLHFMVSPGHAPHAEAWLTDLEFAYNNHGEAKAASGRYSDTA